jgi:CMP-N,N'-diacetyllegionaminic acid synthase
MIKILCIIPARSGSKGIIDKNIIEYKGKPLMAHTIEQAIACKYDMKIIVSTDSQHYADIAIQYGAKVPFIRPTEISGDLSTDYDCISHCVQWLNNNENYVPDIVLQLRITSPTRQINDINKCLELFIDNRDQYDSLRSVIKCEKTPYKMYNINNNVLEPLFLEVNDINEPYNQCRQILPICYLHNGYIDIFNTAILVDNTVSGAKILPYVMNEEDNIDIDHIKDII